PLTDMRCSMVISARASLLSEAVSANSTAAATGPRPDSESRVLAACMGFSLRMLRPAGLTACPGVLGSWDRVARNDIGPECSPDPGTVIRPGRGRPGIRATDRLEPHRGMSIARQEPLGTGFQHAGPGAEGRVASHEGVRLTGFARCKQRKLQQCAVRDHMVAERHIDARIERHKTLHRRRVGADVRRVQVTRAVTAPVADVMPARAVAHLEDRRDGARGMSGRHDDAHHGLAEAYLIAILDDQIALGKWRRR